VISSLYPRASGGRKSLGHNARSVPLASGNGMGAAASLSSAPRAGPSVSFVRPGVGPPDPGLASTGAEGPLVAPEDVPVVDGAIERWHDPSAPAREVDPAENSGTRPQIRDRIRVPRRGSKARTEPRSARSHARIGAFGTRGWSRHSDLNRGPAVYELERPLRSGASVEIRAQNAQLAGLRRAVLALLFVASEDALTGAR
jgi:hypothetical protein